MVRNTEEAVAAALAQHNNVPGMCQYMTRTWLDAPSVGDLDKDGSPDAEDGWKAEPLSARHSDRRPPAGMPVTFRGGSHDNWHRALSLGHGKIRSIDMGANGKYSPGEVNTVTIEDIERAMDLKWEGWSSTISGIPIPVPPPHKSRGVRIDRALQELKAAKGKQGKRREKINRAIKVLESISFIK